MSLLLSHPIPLPLPLPLPIRLPIPEKSQCNYDEYIAMRRAKSQIKCVSLITLLPAARIIGQRALFPSNEMSNHVPTPQQ